MLKQILVEGIDRYIHDLESEFPSITDVWLIGSRANDTARDGSDWDFIVFSSSPIYDNIKNNKRFHRADVDLLVVDENGEFSKPFGEPKGGSLSEWKWRQISANLACHESVKWVPDEEATAEGMADMGRLSCKTLSAHRV